LPNKIFSPKARNLLLKRLLEVENRTYLWLHLVFDIIKQKTRVDTLTIRDLITNLPDTVRKAYDAILDKSADPETARRLLHIVVGASRPLTLKEMNVVLYITDDMHLYEDLELQEEKQFKINVRDLCGLFISIVDNKVFLIHQTVKDYLVKPPGTCPSDFGPWKHSLEPTESNLALANSCLCYLLLVEFENEIFSTRDILSQDQVYRYANEHYFLNYSNHFANLPLRTQKEKTYEQAEQPSVWQWLEYNSVIFYVIIYWSMPSTWPSF
jgi:hypothetical protein